MRRESYYPAHARSPGAGEPVVLHPHDELLMETLFRELRAKQQAPSEMAKLGAELCRLVSGVER